MNAVAAGVFYGVGVGPGDPELITRKAERILRAVDWIFLPAGGADKASFVRRIVEPLALPEAKFRPVSLCMSRDRRTDGQTYRRVAEEIAVELRAGQTAAWLTEGDPLFYSTFQHVYEELRRMEGIRIEIVPGVTSIAAAAARAGLPVACLAERVAVVPAAYGLEKLPALLEDFATVFLLKVGSAMDALLDVLSRLSVPVSAVYLELVGTSAERIVYDLESLRGRELPYFSLVILRRETP
jgi:precorrin-2/cobalt-factor-2 C20-methyltransferase